MNTIDPSLIPWRTLIWRDDLGKFHQARALGCHPPSHALLDLLDETAGMAGGKNLPDTLTRRLVRWVELLAPYADLGAPGLARAAARLQSPPVLVALHRAGLPKQ